MRIGTRLLTLTAALALALAGTACAERHDTFSRAGEKVDDAAYATGQAAKKAAKATAKATKKAVHKTGEALEKAGDKMQEKTADPPAEAPPK